MRDNIKRGNGDKYLNSYTIFRVFILYYTIIIYIYKLIKEVYNCKYTLHS